MKITRIHQIELTSRCNLRCKYCVHPKMLRPKEDMDMETFDLTLAKVKRYVYAGQNELNLAGIGESTMHPEFVNMLIKARMELGPFVKLVIATNGVTFTDEIAKAIAPYNPAVWVSMHRPEKAGPAIEIAKKYGMLHGVSADPSIASMNWAGKVDWHVSCPESTPCPWLHQGMVMVTSDGFVTQCCLDGDGLGVMGHISEDLDAMIVRPYTLCDKCHHTVPAGAACKVTAGSKL